MHPRICIEIAMIGCRKRLEVKKKRHREVPYEISYPDAYNRAVEMLCRPLQYLLYSTLYSLYSLYSRYDHLGT